MGLFDKKGKKAKQDQTPENEVAVQQNVAQGVTEQPVQQVVETPPAVASSELSPVNIDNNPFVEAPMPVAETPVQEVTPQVNLEDIFNATPDDLIMSTPQPTENVQTEVVIPVMEETAATVDTPQPLAEQQVELSVNPTELVSESTIEDEITQLVSAAVDGTTVEVETPTETVPGPSLEQAVSAPIEPEYITEEVSVSTIPQEVSEPQTETTESAPIITDSVPQQEIIPNEEIPVTQEIIQSEEIQNVPQTDATTEPIVQFEQPISENVQVEEIPTLDEPAVAAVSENVMEINNGIDQVQEETFSDITPTDTIIPNEVAESQLETEQLLEAEQSGEAIVELSSEPLIEPAFVMPQESIMATTEPQEETIISVPPVKTVEPEVVVEQVENLPEAAHVIEEVLPTESVEMPVEEIPTEEVEVPVENIEQTVNQIIEEQPAEMPAVIEEQVPTEVEITPNAEPEVTYQEEVQVEPVQEIVEPSELPSEIVTEEQVVEQPIIESVTEEQMPTVENSASEVTEEVVIPSEEQVSEIEMPVETENPILPEEADEIIDTNAVESSELPEEVPEEKPTPIIVEDETVILPIIDVDTELPIGLSSEIPEEPESTDEEQSEESTTDGPLLSPITTPDINITVPEEREETSDQIDESEETEEPTYTEEPEYQEEPIHINQPIEPSINIDVVEHKHEVDPSDYIFPGEEKAKELEDKKMERPHLTERDGIVTYISDPTPTRFCNNCGIMLTDDSSICPSCGEPID